MQRSFRSLHWWTTLDMWMQGCLLALLVVPVLGCCFAGLWIALS